MFTFSTIGDVHLGKKFVTGVPLNRRGERESMVWEQFHHEVTYCGTPYCIQVGDLFDTFAVPEALLLEVAKTYINAARINPEVTYILYRGNHDASRDSDKASSFDVLSKLLEGEENITVLTDIRIHVTPDHEYIGFIPWHPFHSADQLAKRLVESLEEIDPTAKFTAVFGHFDVDSFGGNTFNIIPTKVLEQHTPVIYTGHIHLPTEFTRDNVKVIVVGSMQPYSHAEDAKAELYKTVSFEEVDQIITHDPYYNLNLRVIVRPGNVVPEIDCLSLITKPWSERNEDDDIESDDIEVNFEAFNMQALFTDCLKTANVGSAIAHRIMEKFEELKNA